MVARWLSSLPAGLCDVAIQSCLLCIRVLVLLLNVITGSVTPEALADAMELHLEKHKEAYGDELWRPRHHYSLHLPLQLRLHLTLIACFVHERKHRIFKAWARSFNSKRSMERCLLEECTLTQLDGLAHPLRVPSMPDAREADARMIEALREAGYSGDTILSSITATINSRKVSSRDFVMYQTAPAAPVGIGEVWLHFDIDGSCMTCISQLPVMIREASWAKCGVVGDPVLVDSSCIITSLVHLKPLGGDIVTVLTDWGLFVN